MALEAEFQYYLDHQDELVQRYDGRVIVIVADVVEGDYADEATAFEAAAERFAPGTFLVQRVSAGESDYSQTFYSRVAF